VLATDAAKQRTHLTYGTVCYLPHEALEMRVIAQLPAFLCGMQRLGEGDVAIMMWWIENLDRLK